MFHPEAGRRCSTDSIGGTSRNHSRPARKQADGVSPRGCKTERLSSSETEEKLFNSPDFSTFTLTLTWRLKRLKADTNTDAFFIAQKHKQLCDSLVIFPLKVENPSMPNDEGITPLHNAVCAGHHHIVKFLLDFAVNVNAADSDGWSVPFISRAMTEMNVLRFSFHSCQHRSCI